MKKYFALLLIGFLVFNFANAQICLKPAPLTGQQVQLVAGKWKGSYTSNGSQYNFEINISANTNNEVTCDIDNPPIKGKETLAEYFFCPSGEFHLRKYIGDVSYVFQGVPENNRVKGTISFYDAKNKRTDGGEFSMSKSE